MKMADGGYRPAYNVQFATTVDTQIIIGVDVTNVGSDYYHLHDDEARRHMQRLSLEDAGEAESE